MIIWNAEFFFFFVTGCRRNVEVLAWKPEMRRKKKKGWLEHRYPKETFFVTGGFFIFLTEFFRCCFLCVFFVKEYWPSCGYVFFKCSLSAIGCRGFSAVWDAVFGLPASWVTSRLHRRHMIWFFPLFCCRPARVWEKEKWFFNFFQQGFFSEVFLQKWIYLRNETTPPLEVNLAVCWLFFCNTTTGCLLEKILLLPRSAAAGCDRCPTVFRRVCWFCTVT